MALEVSAEAFPPEALPVREVPDNRPKSHPPGAQDLVDPIINIQRSIIIEFERILPQLNFIGDHKLLPLVPGGTR
jgi:hypothetical protein